MHDMTPKQPILTLRNIPLKLNGCDKGRFIWRFLYLSKERIHPGYSQ